MELKTQHRRLEWKKIRKNTQLNVNKKYSIIVIKIQNV